MKVVSRNESSEHRRMKRKIASLSECYGWEILSIDEKTIGKLRPDILIKKKGVKIAVECQCSELSLEEFIDRTSGYTKMGIPVFWVFGKKFFRNTYVLMEWTRKRRFFEDWNFIDDEEYSYNIQRISLVEKYVFDNNGVIWYFDGSKFYYSTQWNSRHGAKFLGWYNNIPSVSFRVVSTYLERYLSHFVTGGVALVLKKLSKPQFLSAEEVPQGSIITVVEEPYIVPAEQTKWGKERGRVVVRLGDGELRSWTMNNTTWDALVDAFGVEPQLWVGKKIQVDIQQMLIRGETKQVMYGKPYVEPQKSLPT